jgi:quercetin dioxygenase-like cupin family protein
MQITRNTHRTAMLVHAAPHQRPAWHSHPNGRTVYIREGAWLAQRRGGPIEVIGPGDRVFFEPGEEHWHVATPTYADLAAGTGEERADAPMPICA